MQILFITYIYLGDSVLTTSILKHFTDKYPQCEVTVISGQSSQLIFQNFPCVKKHIALVRDRLHLTWFKLWLKVVPTSWDIVVDCRGSNIARFLRAKQKFYKLDKYSKRHKHFSERMKKFLGVNSIPFPYIPLSDFYYKRADNIIKDKKNNYLITIAPVSKGIFKTWPIEYFIKLVSAINAHKKFKNAAFLITAAPHEYQLCMPLLKHLNGRAIPLIKEDILTVAACIQKSKLMISNDSGLMHVAAALGVPTIGLYGPTNEKVFSPFGENKSMVLRTPEPYEKLRIPTRKESKIKHSLMTSLKPEVVFKAFCEFTDQI